MEKREYLDVAEVFRRIGEGRVLLRVGDQVYNRVSVSADHIHLSMNGWGSCFMRFDQYDQIEVFKSIGSLEDAATGPQEHAE